MFNQRIRNMQGTPAHLTSINHGDVPRRSRKKCFHYEDEYCHKQMMRCVGPTVCVNYCDGVSRKKKLIWD